jgi:hypothetical protein
MGDKVGIRERWDLPEPGGAGDLGAASGRRSPALVAVIGLALILVTAPLIVVGLTIADSTMFRVLRPWVQDAPGWLAYLGYARLFLFLPLAAMVIRAKEEA